MKHTYLKEILTTLFLCLTIAVATAQSFVTTWTTTTDNESIRIPTHFDEAYDVFISWGDGVVLEHHTSQNITHTYAVPGTYTVTISSNVANNGNFPRIYFKNTGDKDKIQSIESWGNMNWTSMEDAFEGCSNLVINATDIPDLSNVVSTNRMFKDATSLIDNGGRIDDWDMSTITDMGFMFSNATQFTVPIGNWDTSNVENFTRALQGTSINENLGNWDISNAIQMTAMLNNVGMSKANYDHTLTGWSIDSSGATNDGIDDVPSDISFSGGDSKYCTSIYHRENLIDTYNWTIVDGGSDCVTTDYFITKWYISPNLDPGTITIPTFPGETYNYDVDWSYDGVIFNAESTAITGDATSASLTAGTYTVAIRGTFPRIYFNNSGDRLKILTVEQWGTGIWTSMENAFHSCTNLNITNPTIDAPNLTYVTSTSHMFNGADSFNGTINHWDVSNVTNMRSMLRDAGDFNQDISNWNVSNVTDMFGMFRDARKFNKPIDNWDVSGVEYMSQMFFRADKFNQPLNNWDVSSVTDMERMFSGAAKFNQPLNNWEISNVTNMTDMFKDIRLSITNYDTTLIGWQTDASGIANDGVDDVPSNITFSGGNSLYCTGENARNSLDTTYNWTITDGGIGCITTDYFITTWTVAENETITIPTFSGETYFYDVDWSYDGVTFNAESIAVTGDATSTSLTAGTYTVAIRGTFPRIYFNNTGDKDKIQTIEQWGDMQWSNMSGAFSGCGNLTYNATEAPDLSALDDLRHMFSDCSVFNATDLTNWDVSNVKEMSFMFSGATVFNGNITNWDVSNVISFKSMFGGTDNFNQDISGWTINTNEPVDMQGMFSQSLLFNQPIGIWNVDKVTDMSYMFERASSFNQPLDNWDVSNVTDMTQMFNLSGVDQNFGTWHISNVNDMTDMFKNIALSRGNYDSTLIGWHTDTSGVASDGIDDVPSNITFSGGNSQYCTSASAWNSLDTTFNWTITDGGLGCTTADYFITTWLVTENQTITIPTFTGETYSYEVDWSYDGTTFNAESTNITGDAISASLTAGTYTVAVRGVFPRIYFNNTGDKNKIQTIERWGTMEWSSMENAFFGCSNLTYNATDIPDLSQVDSMQFMFFSASSFNGNIGNWNVSNVTNMFGLFRNARNFNQDINSWNVSNATNMSNMFWDARNFNKPLDNWDVSRVENMSFMFMGARSFNQNINSWNTSNVTTMQEMFNGASLFNQPLNTWDVSKVENIKEMFRYAANFDQSLATWDISNLTYALNMFVGVTLNTANYDATLMGWHTDSSGVAGDGIDDVPYNIPFHAGNSKYCTSETQRADLLNTYSWGINDKGLGCTASDYFITTWTVAENETITIPTNSDNGEIYTYDVDWSYNGSTFNVESTAVTGNATSPILTAGTYTVAIRGAFPRIYFFNSLDKDKIQTIEQWGNIEWTSMYRAFMGCSNLTITNPTIDVPNLSNVTNIAQMFRDASSFNGAINNWDVSTITNMGSMFLNASVFNQPLNSWNVSSVTDMERMFQNATAFNQPLNDWDVSSVENMLQMFMGATSFDQPLGSWDITNVTDMNDMFEGVTISTANYDATLIGWHTDVSGVANDGIDDIPSNINFHGGNSKYCVSETQKIDLISTYNWNITDGGTGCTTDYFITTWTVAENETITIPTTGNNYNYDVDWSYDGTTFNAESMNVTGDATSSVLTAGSYTVAIRGAFSRIYFNNSGDKDKIQTIEQWGTTQWTSMENAFYGCTNLNITNISIDVPNLNLVKNMKSMFRDASNFNGVINNWDVSSVENMSFMFFNAITFNQVLNNWNTSNLTDINHMFFNADVFNQSLNSWDVSNVTRMGNLFTFAIAYNQPLNNWNVSSVEDMSSMFSGATSFNQPLNNWNVQDVTGMYNVFSGALSFNQPLADWDLSNVSGMDDMLKDTTLSMANYDATLLGWHTDVSGVANDGIDDIPLNINFHGGNSQYCSAEAARNDLDTTYNWTITDGGLGCTPSDYFITTWTVAENETIVIPTFTGENYTYDVDWSYDGAIFNAESTAVIADATSPVLTAGTYTVAIRGVFPRIYFNNTGDKDKIQTVQQWGIGVWTSMERAFYGCKNLSVTATDAPDLSGVTIMNLMFAESGMNQNINHWDVSTITQMYRLFFNSSFNQPLSLWNTSNVVNMRGIFHANPAFNQDISDWDVGKVTNFSQLFLTNISAPGSFTYDLSQWNIGEFVSGTINMAQMFKNQISFNENLNSWDVGKVSDMTQMFEGATTFDQNLSDWDISSVTLMADMFKDITLSTENYDATLIGWHTDSSGVASDGIDDVPSNITFSGGNSLYCTSVSAWNDLDTTYSWTITDSGADSNCGVMISPKVYLQGAFLNPNAGEETLMRDDLRVGGYIPTISPYSDALSCDATVFNSIGIDAIVDWVWIELRDKTDNTVIIDSQSALLQRDGDVVEVDGISNLEFDQPADDYYVAIKHRNHLGIMSANTIALSGAVTTIDFTNATGEITYGTNAQTMYGMPSGVVAMWAGDASGNGSVNLIGDVNDTNTIRDTILNDPINQIIQFYGFNVSGYSNSDVNLTGGAQIIGVNNDANLVRDNILNHPINTFIQFYGFNITQQLPENTSGRRVAIDEALLKKMQILSKTK